MQLFEAWRDLNLSEFEIDRFYLIICAHVCICVISLDSKWIAQEVESVKV